MVVRSLGEFRVSGLVSESVVSGKGEWNEMRWKGERGGMFRRCWRCKFLDVVERGKRFINVGGERGCFCFWGFLCCRLFFLYR